MKNNIRLIALLTAIFSLLAVSCAKEIPAGKAPAASSGKVLRVSVSAGIPAMEDDETGTKTTFSGEKLVWTGDETMGVMFGNSSSTTSSAASWHTASLSNDRTNTFSGEVSLTNSAGTEFNESELACVCVPAGSNCLYYRSGSNLCGYFPIPATQTQKYDNVMNGEYFPLYLPVTDEIRANAKQPDGSYLFEGITLKWACSAIRFNVYGTHASMEADEVLKSVKIYSEGKFNRASMVVLSSGSSLYSNDYAERTIVLENPVTIAGKTSENGVKLFMSIASRNYNATMDEIVIETDKAVYTKRFSSPKKISGTVFGKVYQFGLDIATFTRGLEYSIDDGATWSGSIPETSFSSLAVRGYLTADGLTDIRTAIDAQTAVDLDLSGTYYESTTFPAVFGSSTAANASKKLAGIIFPSNIRNTAASAFYNCTGLKQVRLDGLTALSTAQGQNYAFAKTGLVSVTIPSSITSYMDRSFCSCKDLQEVRYEAAWNPGTGYNYRLFQWGTGTSDTNDAHTGDLVLTIGSNVKNTPQSFFRNNNNLTKVVIEGDSCVLINYSFYGCRNLSVIEMKGSVPAKINHENVYTNMGASVTGDKKIIIPHGATAAYTGHANWASWNTVITTLGYTLEEAE